MKLPIVCTDDRLRPTRAHNHDAGLDLRCAYGPWFIMEPGQRQLVDTGIRVAIPAGYAGLIHPRSGLARNYGVTVLNAPGTVDSGYTGTIKVNLINHGKQPVVIRYADRIAQLLIQRVELPELDFRDELPGTQRGNNGHGSTGK